MKILNNYKGVFITLILAALIAMYFHHMSNLQTSEEDDGAAITSSAATTALQRNLAVNYPATPKEVVKYFSELTQCFYNEHLEDSEVDAVADQILLLYDDKLVAAKSYDEYLFDLKQDIAFYNMNGYTISSFSPSASTDVEYFSQDGSDWARLWCVYTIKSGKNYKPLQEVFILRKDEKSHWRIFGWQLVEEETESKE